MGYIDLVVLIGALAAAAAILPSALSWNHMAFSAQVAKVEAGQLSNITDAALQYEYANSAALDIPGSSHTVTVAELIAQGYLPAGTKATDPFGDQIEVIFNADAGGNITGYVVDQGQKAYSDREAGQILLALGDRGGYDPASPLPGQQPNTIYGAGDTWQSGAPAGVAPGSIEVEVEPNAAQEADDSRFLWRVPAPSAAENTMSTPLIMSAVESVGASCPYTGAIAQNGSGALVTCQGGLWTAVSGGHWRAPVSTYAALPMSGNQNGDVRLTLDTDRAFAWNGGSWVALAVNQNGNLHVPGNGDFGGDLNVSGEIGTNGYTPHTGLPPGWGGGIQTWDIVAHGTIGVGPNNSSPNATMNNSGTIENQGVCIDNNSGSCNGWGLSTHYTDGWGMVAQDGPGNLNVAPGSALGSVNVNDIDVRSGGAYPWYSQLSSQVYSDTQQLNAQQGQINTLNNEYSNQQGEINGNTNAIDTINSNLNNSNPCGSSTYAALQSICAKIQNAGGSYIGEFGPATGTVTTQQVCRWQYTYQGYQYICTDETTTGPASASGSSGGGTMTVDGTSGGPYLTDVPLLVSVTGLVGSKNPPIGSNGADWGGLSTPCNTNGVGASILAYVDGIQVADISLTKTGQPDYDTWVATENTATFLVPAGQTFNIESNNTCSQFQGIIWAL